MSVKRCAHFADDGYLHNPPFQRDPRGGSGLLCTRCTSLVKGKMEYDRGERCSNDPTHVFTWALKKNPFNESTKVCLACFLRAMKQINASKPQDPRAPSKPPIVSHFLLSNSPRMPIARIELKIDELPRQPPPMMYPMAEKPPLVSKLSIKESMKDLP